MTKVPMGRPISIFATLAVLAALTLLAYGSAGGAGFVRWDDSIHVFENPYLTPLSAQSLGYFWHHAYEGLYIPLSYDAFGLLAAAAQTPDGRPAPTTDPDDDVIAPLDPHVFHWANILLHTANVLLVFLLLRRLVGRDDGAVAGALLFGLHPVQVESVAWVSELRGLLAALFSLLALLGFLRGLRPPGGAYIALATAAFATALLCKPSAVVVPLLVAALGWWELRGRPRTEWPVWLPRLLGSWVALSVAALVVTHIAQPSPTAVAVFWWQRPLVAADALAFYLGKLVFPYPLGIDYGRTPASVVARPTVWLEALLVLALGAAAWAARQRAPVVALGTVLSVIVLLPVLGLVPFDFQDYSTVADRYLYLALLGPALVVAWYWPRAGLPLRGVCGVALVVLAMLTWWQCAVWRDDVSLFRQALVVNPRSGMAYVNLGVAYTDLHRYPEAETALRRGLLVAQIAPAKAMQDLGNIALDQGDMQGAISEWQAAVRLDDKNPTLDMSLGQAYLRVGRFAEADTQLQAAARLAPDPSDAAVPHFLDGNALFALDRFADAAAAYTAGLRGHPDDEEAHFRLGLVLARMGQIPQARAEMEQAQRLRPDDPRVGQALAALPPTTGRVQ